MKDLLRFVAAVGAELHAIHHPPTLPSWLDIFDSHPFVHWAIRYRKASCKRVSTGQKRTKLAATLFALQTEEVRPKITYSRALPN